MAYVLSYIICTYIHVYIYHIYHNKLIFTRIARGKKKMKRKLKKSQNAERTVRQKLKCNLSF